MFKLYKNVCIYRLTRDIQLDAAKLRQAMADHPFTQCSSQESGRRGWLMNADNTPFMLQFDNVIHIVQKKERREVPKEALDAELAKKVDEWEQRMRTTIRRQEKSALKDEVFQTLLPRAFSKTSFTQILINLNTGIIMIDAASARVAEDALALLRKSLGSLPVVPVMAETPPELTMTEWVRHYHERAPEYILIEEKKLTMANLLETGMKASFSNHEVNDIIRELAENNNQITSLSLLVGTEYRLSLVLDADCTFKRIIFSETLKESAVAKGEETIGEDEDREARQQLINEATFILMAQELSQAFEIIMRALGGEAKV
ncbi:TPA: recombination-associated protein RdgC [Enterobacter hormaechei subsp. xiangfangensis]|nr:recombination-associated protein RdgC [Enterobacter hormaechei subsp. xiangfangensis]